MKGSLYALYLAHTLSLTGNMITLIALPLYVLGQTGSAVATGIAGVVATLPIVLGDLFGGTVVDRLGYWRASILTDLCGGLVVMLVPLLHITVGLPIWAVLGLAFVGNLIDAPGQTARRAMLPEVAQEAGVPLERAVGWMEATERGARLLGAPLAGVLIATWAHSRRCSSTRPPSCSRRCSWPGWSGSRAQQRTWVSQKRLRLRLRFLARMAGTGTNCGRACGSWSRTG